MDTQELQGMMAEAMIALRDLRAVDDRAHRLILDEIQRIWDDHAELRDEIHAVANRVETLTRAMMVDAHAVAAKLVEQHGIPCTECGEMVYVDHLDPALPSPIRNAGSGTKHTCHIRSVPDAKPYDQDAS